MIDDVVSAACFEFTVRPDCTNLHLKPIRNAIEFQRRETNALETIKRLKTDGTFAAGWRHRVAQVARVVATEQARHLFESLGLVDPSLGPKPAPSIARTRPLQPIPTNNSSESVLDGRAMPPPPANPPPAPATRPARRGRGRPRRTESAPTARVLRALAPAPAPRRTQDDAAATGTAALRAPVTLRPRRGRGRPRKTEPVPAEPAAPASEVAREQAPALAPRNAPDAASVAAPVVLVPPEASDPVQ
ncbi:hypothetical protein KEM55_000045 [Ascosphaera atra]|nr:hypothetical protein KEM55_000045 [Ascosphaera atra]